MMNSDMYSNTTIAALKKNLKTTTQSETAMNSLSEAMTKLNCWEYLCQAKKMNLKSSNTPSACTTSYYSSTKKDSSTKEDPCSKIKEAQESYMTSISAVADGWMESNLTLNRFEAYDKTNLQAILNELDSRITALQQQLDNAPKLLPPLAAVASGTGTMTQKELDDNWMSFSFDSKSSISKTTKSSTSYKAAISVHDSGLSWSVSGSASYSRSTENFAADMSQSDMSVSVKMLRVTFNRNWFQPSIFSIQTLHMVSKDPYIGVMFKKHGRKFKFPEKLKAMPCPFEYVAEVSN